MKADVVLAGVGGQGVVTVARLLAEAGRRSDLAVKQSELHGMARRGGAVQAMVRLADRPIDADLVPEGTADVLLALEPLEGLRNVRYLGPGGIVVAAAEPVENIGDYPLLESLYAALRALPRCELVDAKRLARDAGAARSANMAMIGAATAHLPLDSDVVVGVIREWSSGRRARHADVNIAAFRLGLRTAPVPQSGPVS